LTIFLSKRDGNLEELFSTISELTIFNPNFISVTYGAGGSNKNRALEIASMVKNGFGREVLALYLYRNNIFH
jgi:methylenetetrahydrofolate reductase (NADPH)